MATAPVVSRAEISLDDYLQTIYHPDCDFVDGHLEERNVGDVSHSLLQAELAFWFRSRGAEWNIRVMTELRTRVSSSRVRLADVGVAYNDLAMKDKIREKPLLIAIEVLSPEDRLARMLVRLADFWKMGIRNIWVLDPAERAAMMYTEDGLKAVESDRLTVVDTPIYLDLSEVFSALD